MTKTRAARGSRSSTSRQIGFSLIELLVSMAVFMTISGAALTLFRQQQLSQQDLGGRSGLNLGLRNSVSQLQMDLANAGSGYFPGLNIPSWPIGVTVNNRVVAAGNSCYNAGTFTYGVNCFDTLNIISADPAMPPVHTTDSTGGALSSNCSVTSTNPGGPTTAYLQAATGLNPTTGLPYTLATTASLFRQGDQLLFLTGGTSATQITTVVLTQNATVAGGAVRLNFNGTNAGGINGGGPNGALDPLDITTCEGRPSCTLIPNPVDPLNPPKVTDRFCGSDWVLKLAPVIYTVDNANPQDPILMRQVGIGGARVPVMDQAIGFKVGVTLWNGATVGTTGSDLGNYVYDANAYCNNNCTVPPAAPPNPGDRAYNFSLVRSIRVSLIGRTTPDYRGTYKFRNTFDNGPYQVQGVAVVVNPRNLSMNDQ